MSRIYSNKLMKCVLVTCHKDEQGICKPVKSVTAMLGGSVMVPIVLNYCK